MYIASPCVTASRSPIGLDSHIQLQQSRLCRKSSGTSISPNTSGDPKWTSYQIRKIVGCACTGNARNVFPCRRLQRKLLVSDPGMHHGTCVTHVSWCMSGSLTRDGGENVPGIPGACTPAILPIWQEAHAWDFTTLNTRTMYTQTPIIPEAVMGCSFGDLDKSYIRQVAPMTTRTKDTRIQDNSEPGYLVPGTARTPCNSYAERWYDCLVRVNSYHHWTSHTRRVKELMNGKSLHCQCKYHSRYFYITVILKAQITQPDYLFLRGPDAQMYMMTSSNGNIFRVTGHLCGEFPGHWWIPHTKASDAELWRFLWSVPE